MLGKAVATSTHPCSEASVPIAVEGGHKDKACIGAFHFNCTCSAPPPPLLLSNFPSRACMLVPVGHDFKAFASPSLTHPTSSCPGTLPHPAASTPSCQVAPGLCPRCRLCRLPAVSCCAQLQSAPALPPGADTAGPTSTGGWLDGAHLHGSSRGSSNAGSPECPRGAVMAELRCCISPTSTTSTLCSGHALLLSGHPVSL